MSENQEHKTWKMLKKSLKIEDFTVCPWTDGVWTDGMLEATCKTKYGVFNATSNDKAAKNGIKYAFLLPGQSKGTVFLNYKQSVTVNIKLPTGAEICPRKLFLDFSDSGSVSCEYKCSVSGYNVATGIWDTLYSFHHTKLNSKKVTHNVTLNTANFYNEFQVYAYTYDGTDPYMATRNFGVMSGIIKYK